MISREDAEKGLPMTDKTKALEELKAMLAKWKRGCDKPTIGMPWVAIGQMIEKIVEILDER